MVVTPDQWSRGISGNFNTASDWSTDFVPGFGNDAEITANGTYTVTVNSVDGVEVNGLETAALATLAIAEGTFIAYDGTDTGASAGTIAVDNNSIFEIGGYNAGSSPIDFDATGLITLNSTGSPTMLVLNGSTGDQTVQLSGDGKLILSDNAGNLVVGYGTITTTFLNDNLIKGAGTIGGSNFELQNAGTIDADDGVPLIIIGGFSATNSGTIECTSSGGLYLVNTTLDNLPGGTIEAAAPAAVIELANTTIDDGDVSTVAGSSIVSVAGTDNEINVGAVTNAGDTVVQPGSLLSFGAAVDDTNSGTIALDSSGGAAAELLVRGGLYLEGKGKVTLSDNSQNLIGSNGPGTTLNNQNNAISGAGTIGDANMTLVQGPTGVIDGTGKNALIIAATGGDFENFGKVETSSTGGLQFLQVTVNNESSGVVQTTAAGAHIDLAGSTIEFGLLQIAAGSTIDSIALTSIPVTSTLTPTDFDNSGTLLVNDGSVMVLGSDINNAGIVLVVGTLEIDGDVLLNGTGKVDLVDTGELLSNGSTVNLTNVGNTISGEGTLGDANVSFTNDAHGVIDATGGVDNPLLVAAAANTIFNEGKMEDTGAGGLIFSSLTTVTNDNAIESDGAGGVTLAGVVNNGKLIADSGILSIANLSAGTGSLTIGGSGEIEFGSSDTGIFQNATFAAGAAGTLAFQAAATTMPTSIYTGTIFGFVPGDAIDLAGLSYSNGGTSVAPPVFSASSDDTTVTVTNGTDTVALTFAGNLTSHTFVAGDDGTGGTRLTDPVSKSATGDTPVNVSLLGSYMAALFATAEGQVGAQTATAETAQSHAVLAHPHTG